MNGKYLELSAIDTMYLQAAAYILHGGESNIGGHTSWFGRVNGYDLWADAGASFAVAVLAPVPLVPVLAPVLLVPAWVLAPVPVLETE